MIELYLIVWTFISQSSGTYLNGGEQIEKYTVQISSSFVCPEKPCQVKVYPLKFFYCEFYGHKWEELNPCENGRYSYFSQRCPIEQCYFCKKKRRKKVTEEWEEEK